MTGASACTDEAAALLAKEGFDPQFGARPLKRLIVHSVENVLSKKIVNGEVKAGDRVEIYVNNGAIDVKWLMPQVYNWFD